MVLPQCHHSCYSIFNDKNCVMNMSQEVFSEADYEKVSVIRLVLVKLK